MNETLETTAKQISDQIINLAVSLDEYMERWSDVSVRPDNLNTTECAGFITKETAAADQLNLVIDIQAPANKHEAVLRVWAIKSLPGKDMTLFDNIQLDFDINYDKAREQAQKAQAITHDDLRSVLHDQDTHLTHLIVSNQSGFDETSQQPVGERYDLTVSQQAEQDDSVDKIQQLLPAVLLALRTSAVNG